MPTGWKFDPISAVVTTIGIPLLVFLGAIFLKNLKEWSQYLVNGILYWIGRYLKRSIAARVSLRQYCALSLRGNSRTLPVPSKSDVVLDTDKVFVPLRLEDSSSNKEHYTHETILRVGNRIRIVGDPGSGKSSLIKKIFRDECRTAVTGGRPTRLPILIELRDVPVPERLTGDQAYTWMHDFLRMQVTRAAVYRMDDCFDTYCRTSGILVLLDGLDEVATDRFPQLSKLINGLSDHLQNLGPSNAIIVTLRTHFNQQVRDSFAQSFPQAAVVQPFTPTDIYEFITRWPFAHEAGRRFVDIYRNLMDRPTLREMCTNPLVLAMYVADYESTGEALIPDTRTEFYSAVCEELLIKRRLRQTGPVAGKGPLREQREIVLGVISYRHLLNTRQPANSIPWKESVNLVSETVGVPYDRAEEMLREIGKETGLISEERFGETMRFIHLTFCEFLSAKYAVQQIEDGWPTMVTAHAGLQGRAEPWLQARLIEVLAFAAGLLPPLRRRMALNDILSLQDPRITVRAFLETKMYDHASFAPFLNSESNRLASFPTDKWDAQWLQGVHLFNVVMRDAKSSAKFLRIVVDSDVVDAFIHRISTGGTDALGRLFAALATHDAAAALRLSESTGFDLPREIPDVVIRSCDQAPFYALMRERAASRDAERDHLIQLFAEASLRSAVVRSFVSQSPLPLTGIDRRSIRTDWTSGLQLDRAQLSLVALALGARARGKNQLQLPLLSVLQHTPGPRVYVWVSMIGSISLTLMSLLLVAGAVVLIFGGVDREQVQPRALILSAAVVGVLTFCILLYTSVNIAYRLLLGWRGEGPIEISSQFEHALQERLRISGADKMRDSSFSRGEYLSTFSLSRVIQLILLDQLRMVTAIRDLLSTTIFVPPRLRTALKEMESARRKVAIMNLHAEIRSKL